MDMWYLLSQAMRGPNGDEPVVGTRFKRIFIKDASNAILLQIGETSSYIIPVMIQIPLRFGSVNGFPLPFHMSSGQELRL